MKVIFLEDVPNVAHASETKEVNDGYARNYLLPKKLAVLANSQAAGKVEAQLKKRAREQAKNEAAMKELAKMVEGKEVTFQAKAGAEGKLFGSVTGADIVGEMEKRHGLVIDKRKVDLAEAIKQTGSYDVIIKLTGDITATVKVNVLEEEESK
jgi:large subunit ribosomal protein L9